MSKHKYRTQNRVRIAGGVLLGVALLLGALMTQQGVQAEQTPAAKASDSDVIALGREMFLREWLPNDPRSHGGDGLGPVFNESSCVACHNLGGPGGGGAASKNVDIVSMTASHNPALRQLQQSSVDRFIRSLVGIRTTPEQVERIQQQVAVHDESQRRMFSRVHPGFASSKSVVLHRFGTDPAYAAWRQGMLGDPDMRFVFAQPVMIHDHAVEVHESVATTAEHPESRRIERIQKANQDIQRVKQELGNTTFSRVGRPNGLEVRTTQRNPIALFGAGLIDSIPDDVIEQVALRQNQTLGEIQGRISRLKDGRIGRFGWKGQTATLRDFAITACAVEVGLHVPEHAQSGVPLDPDYAPPGFDMTAKECDALVAYLTSLPAPSQLPAPRISKSARHGANLFAEVGCASCHTPKLGEVDGIYSDLLLHDMGEEMVDTGEYGVFSPGSPGEDQQQQLMQITEVSTDENGQVKAQLVGATQREWRTPPLWGCRDSAPYLHDGRAQTLEQAIAFHGGEAAGSAREFFMLTPQEQQQLIAYLKTLVAPDAVQFASVQK